jgi:transposase
MNSNVKSLGIDLHSNNFTYCLIYPDGTKEKGKYGITSSEMEEFYKLLDLETVVLVEASTNTFAFVKLIKERVQAAYVANTHKLKLISMVKKKTDRLDAEKLAIFVKMQISSGEELIKPVYIPDEKIQELRSLFTTYQLMRRQIGAVKNRIHSILKQNLCPFTKEYIFGKKTRKIIKELNLSENAVYQIEFLMRQLEHQEKSIEEIEEYILMAGATYYREIEILTSMKGISVMTAIAIIADVAEIERFPNSKHFTSYLRSAPGVDHSNEEVRVTSTNKFGRKLSVTLISQSLNHFRDSNPNHKTWYEGKTEGVKKKGKYRMALCRRVLAEIFQMLKKGEYHNFRDERNHLKKMEEYNKFLGRKEIVFKKSA